MNQQHQQQGSALAAIAKRIFFLIVIVYCIAFFVDNVVTPEDKHDRHRSGVVKMKESARSTLADVVQATSAKIWN